MSLEEYPKSQIQAKRLEVKEATELAQFYHVPQSLMNMMFIQFGDVAYPKEAFLLHLGHRKGIQRIEVDQPTLENGEWHTEARIYPQIRPELITAISSLTEPERRDIIKYVTMPVREWGRASSKNVRMSTMQEWLDTIAIKRAVCRALRLFVGIGATSYEELPEVVVEKNEAEYTKHHALEGEKESEIEVRAEPPKPALEAPPSKTVLPKVGLGPQRLDQ